MQNLIGAFSSGFRNTAAVNSLLSYQTPSVTGVWRCIVAATLITMPRASRPQMKLSIYGASGLSSSIPPHKFPNCFAVSKVSAGIPMTLLDLIVIPRVGSNVIANRNTLGVGSISDQSVGPVQVHTSAPTEKHPCRLVWSTHKRLCIA